MPLKSGKSKKTISANIGELVNTFKEKGKIGTSTPGTMNKALAQASAIAFAKARKSKK